MIKEIMNDWKVEYKPQKEWSVSLMWMEMASGAIGVGLFLVSIFTDYTLGMVIGFLLGVGAKGIFLLLDLGRPERALNVLRKPFRSWISAGAWALGIFAAASLLYTGSALLGLSLTSALMIFLKVVAVIAGVVVIIYEGFFLADSLGVPFWTSGLLPMLFGVTAVTAGTGMWLALKGLFGGADMQPLVVLNAVLIILSALFVATYLSTMANSSSGGKRSVAEVLRGKFSGAFLAGYVLVGLVLPLLVVGAAAIGLFSAPLLIALAGLLEAVGVAFLRYTILYAGINTPVM